MGDENSFFKGLKVLELASVLAGPSAGMYLAELGASVIKVENLKAGGDVTRNWNLPEENTDSGISAYFSSANWGKRSLGINLDTPEGKDVIYKLLAATDIVISSYKKGDDQKLGMDHDTFIRYKPDVIYAAISGYGANDDRIAYDAVLQAESGFMSMNGEAGGPPVKMPVALIDILAAHQLKEGILVALIKRLTTGKGSYINISLMDSALASLANQASNYLMAGHIPTRIGSRHPNIAPYGDLLMTSDGQYIILAVGSDGQFQKLCKALNISGLGAFATNSLRLQNRTLLMDKLQEAAGNLTAMQLMHKLQKAKVPAGLVQDIKAALSGYAHMLHRAGEIASVRQSVNGGDTTPPPQFGQHSKSILLDSGFFSQEETENLFQKGIIGTFAGEPEAGL